QRRFHLDARPGPRMREPEPRRMQEQTTQSRGLFENSVEAPVAVAAVEGDRVPQLRAVRPELVLAAGLRAELDAAARPQPPRAARSPTAGCRRRASISPASCPDPACAAIPGGLS